MQVHLYQFSHNDYPDEIIYVLSTYDDIKDVRKYSGGWDHGGSNYESFAATLKEGNIKEVKSLKEVDKQDYGCLPYTTDELVECEELGGDYFDIEINIVKFFKDYIDKEFEPD